MVPLDRVEVPSGVGPADLVVVLRDLAFDAGAHDNISIIYADTDR